MPFNTTYATNILNWIIGKTAQSSLPAHSKVFLGLCSNDPEADNGTFTELSGGSYGRVLINQYNQEFPGLMSVSGRAMSNSKQIGFNKATAKWTTAKGFGLFTAETGGTPFYYAKLKNPVDTDPGAVFLFDPGELKIAFQTTDVDIE